MWLKPTKAHPSCCWRLWGDPERRPPTVTTQLRLRLASESQLDQKQESRLSVQPPQKAVVGLQSVQGLQVRAPLTENTLLTSLFNFLKFLSVISSVQWLSRVWLFATPRTTAHQASLSITNSWSLFKLISIELVMPSSHLILCCPLLLLPSIFPSIRVFSKQSVLPIRWPKYWSFSFNISPSNEYSGLISFRIDCFNLLAIQGTLQIRLQHHSSKASILWHSAFFIVHSHIHTWLLEKP